MTSPDSAKRAFLLGSIVLVGLIVVGLVWALASGGPGTSNLSFDDTNGPVTGPATSTVTVRVFGDFQCPACRAAEPAFGAMKKTYGDRVRIIWNDFPLQAVHQNAMIAANAARCAQDQGKFWEFHDTLYQNQPSWDALSNPSDTFATYAGTLGLDVGQFSSCLSAKKDESKITADLEEGTRNQIEATPTFFINDLRIVGVVDPEVWTREITARLK